MPIYSVFNLRLRSSILLPELMEVDKTSVPDVVLKLDSLGLYHYKHDSGFCYRGAIQNILRFIVYEGKEIIIDPSENVDISLVRSALYGPIFSILLCQLDLLVLHGSCVALHDSAIAFLGHSRAGKSTLAEAFYCQNYPVITDDVLAISLAADYPQALPSIPRIKLWPDSALAMGHQLEQLPPIHSNSSKRAHLLPPISITTLPLSSIYILGESSEISITKLSPQHAFLKLLKNTRAAQVLNHPRFMKFHFKQCTTLLHKIPIYLLTRPFDLSAVSKTIKEVEDHEHRTLSPTY
ncbi:serine kinase [Acaryochloris marina NIES-2412]|uniref:serine kinase n=1 Tax=Acaryochloris marina TaxID=155978 RepID=UPI0040591128